MREIVFKEYENDVVLIYQVHRGFIDYFFKGEYKNSIVADGLSWEEFLKKDNQYEEIVGYKCDVGLKRSYHRVLPDIPDDILEKLFSK